ncbi:MAG: tRNA 2-thiouridine(34) synthase MnmA [Planctomycetota bacterium]
MARVVLAMSGGVDSSVAAHLLKEDGHEVIGVFMRHGEKAIEACAVDGEAASSPLLPVLNNRADHKQGCCSASDAEDGRRVAQRLDIPFYALNLEEEFRGIIDYFVDEYTVGRTPNPCVMCNNKIKFGKLFDYADSVNADFLATGHYAQLKHDQDGVRLLRGVDASKDQSYVLFGIKSQFLDRMILPIGQFEKPVIREIATTLGLNVATKKDSQEICFVTSGKHDEFVRSRRTEVDTSGLIKTVTGEVVGEHNGIEKFTIGQRKGLGVAMGEPYFVSRIDAESYDVVIGKKEALSTRQLVASRVNWLETPEESTFEGLVQFRYNSTAVLAMIEVIDEQQILVRFEELQHGVSPGQAVVCYRGDQVLGGGWIDQTYSESESG